jgi:hypothetical protein
MRLLWLALNHTQEQENRKHGGRVAAAGAIPWRWPCSRRTIVKSKIGSTNTSRSKIELFNKLALALKVHTKIEEEIFYAEERGDVEDDMLDEAQVEHDGAKKMIAEIEAMKPGDDLYDAKVKVLGEYIKHHVKEEEQPGGIFAQAKKGEEDLEEMGERLKARKEQLMTEMARKQH